MRRHLSEDYRKTLTSVLGVYGCRVDPHHEMTGVLQAAEPDVCAH